MNRTKYYRVPDVIDILYQDIVNGLYFPINYGSVKNRILISKCNIACDLLINSTISEHDIVKKLDFPDYETFCCSFEKLIGIFPKDFRHRFA